MSNQRERLIKSIGTSGDGHAVKLNESEFTAPKQATGLPLSPVRRLSPGEVTLSKKNSKAFDPLSQPDFERLKADIAERGIIVPLILKADKTLIAGHNRLRAVQALNKERGEKGEPPLTVPVQYVETSLSPAQEKAFVIKDNLLRRQLDGEQKAKLIADLYGEQIRQTQHGGARGNQHKKSAKVHVNLAKKIEADTGIKAGTAKRIIADIKRLDSQRKTPSDSTGKAQSSAASQGKKGRGENEKALRAFASGLNNSLRGVELENAQTLKAAVSIAKAWLKTLRENTEVRRGESLTRKKTR